MFADQASAERPFLKKRRQRTSPGPCSLNSKEGVSASRRFHLYLSSELESRLRRFASRRGLALAVALRELAALGLEAADQPPHLQPIESPGTLAALVAAEHAVLAVASVLPDGERRIQELASQAATAAEARLAMFRQAEP